MNPLRFLGDEKTSRAVGTLLIALPLGWSAIAYLYKEITPEPVPVISIDAAEFVRGEGVNVYSNSAVNKCWVGLLASAPPYISARNSSAEFRFQAKTRSTYTLMIEYASSSFVGGGDKPNPAFVKAGVQRPVRVVVNGAVLKEDALAANTGSKYDDWCNHSTRWETIGNFESRRGTNRIVLSRDNAFPHIKGLRIVLD